MSKIRLLSAIAALFCVTGCQYLMQQQAFVTPEITYSEKAPKLDIKKYFNGDIDLAAVVQDADNRVINTFTAKINGKWEENRGTVQYNYLYEGGKKTSRTWLYTLEQDGSFAMVGHDISTPGTGKQIGNAAQMLYSLFIPYDNIESKQNISFIDNTYLIDGASAILISEARSGGKLLYKTTISLKKSSSVTSNKEDIAAKELAKEPKEPVKESKDKN